MKVMKCLVQGAMPKPDDELALPFFRKRVICQYINEESGMDQMHLFYGQRELLFDDQALSGFGEFPARQRKRSLL